MITAAVLTISDKGFKGRRVDESGPFIKDMLKEAGFEVKYYEVLPDEKSLIKKALIKYSNKVNLIITTGGTGLSPRDVTPDATREVIDKEVPGIAEAIRAYGLKKTKRAMLSRAVAGLSGKTLIINIPGSLKAVKDSLKVILEIIPHAVEKILGSKKECGR